MSFRLFLYSSALCRLKLHQHCKQIHMNSPGSKHGRVLSHKTTVCKHPYTISQSRLCCDTKYYNSCDYLWKQNHSCSDTHYNNTIPNGILIFYYCFYKQHFNQHTITGQQLCIMYIQLYVSIYCAAGGSFGGMCDPNDLADQTVLLHCFLLSVTFYKTFRPQSQTGFVQ